MYPRCNLAEETEVFLLLTQILTLVSIPYMNKTITVTEKGQITLPVAARKAMKIRSGDKVILSYDAMNYSLKISKAPSLEELSGRLTSYIKPGTVPVTDVDAYFQKHREAKEK